MLWKARHKRIHQSCTLLFGSLEDLADALQHGFKDQVERVGEGNIRQFIHHHQEQLTKGPLVCSASVLQGEEYIAHKHHGGVSRQGVYDNLNRTEALLRKMEENIGCVSRDLERRKAMRVILEAAETLRDNHDETVSNLARAIIDACEGLEE